MNFALTVDCNLEMDPYKSALTAHILYETQNSEPALMGHI